MTNKRDISTPIDIHIMVNIPLINIPGDSNHPVNIIHLVCSNFRVIPAVKSP